MKRRVLWLALAATLIAVYFAPRMDQVPVIAAAKASQNTSRNTPAASGSTSRAAPALDGFDLQIHPRKAEPDLGNVFASHTWTPPPPPKAIVKMAPPPPPEAPPLPFRFLGRLVDDGKTAYFLQFNDRNLVMHIGDTVDKTYTLESISAGTLTFAYLPLNKKQILAVGEVN